MLKKQFLQLHKRYHGELFCFETKGKKENHRLLTTNYLLSTNTGQVFRCNSGQAAIISLLFFVTATVVLVVGTSASSFSEELKTRSASFSNEGYFLSEAGQEDALYRLMSGKPISNTVTLSLGGNTATTTITALGTDKKDIITVGAAGNNIRKTKVTLVVGEGASFVYGVHVGEGGLLMENNSSILGNVFSNGPVVGENSNIVRGDVISAGVGGLIDGVYATSSAYAHAIKDSFVEGDAHYESISETTVLGALFPGSTPEDIKLLPISDQTIQEFEATAEAGGVISSPCPYKIEEDTRLGPAKITCDVHITGSPVVTLAGPIWILGDLLISNTAQLSIDSLLQNQSIAVVVDNPANRSTSSKIKLQNSSEFFGGGQANSYILLISQNNSTEDGGDEVAIDVSNSVSGDFLLYAGHGEILLQNNIQVREVTGYKVHLKNSAAVSYEAGVQNLLFEAGPSGGYEIIDWKEIE